MKRYLISILSGIVLLVGILLMLYPVISDYWNSLHQSQAIAAYSGQIQSMGDDSYNEIWETAKLYNQTILHKNGSWAMDEEERRVYNSLLNPGGDGIMGYVEIPAIKVSLPIYHGTDEAVLQVAVGHIEWSSLPVGGESSHCVFSGHRGLPSARLFTDLDQMKEGDQIILSIMEEKLIYEVDQIVVVEPDETEELLIVDGQDLCTLVTCTPYGINTHRLLVRGRRVDNLTETQIVRIAADAVKVEIPFGLSAVLIGIAVAVAVGIWAGHRRKKSKKNKINFFIP